MNTSKTLLIVWIMSCLLGTIGTAKANQSMDLLNQKTREIAREIGDSWPSVFSTNAEEVKDYAGEQIDEVKDKLANLVADNWSHEMYGENAPIGFVYVGKRENTHTVSGSIFDIQKDCMRCSPDDSGQNDYRATKAVYTKYFFHKHYLPALKKYRTLRGNFKNKTEPKKPFRLGKWNPKSAKAKRKGFAVVKKAAQRSKPALKIYHRKSEIVDRMKEFIANEECQTGLFTMKNAYRVWGSGEQWLIAHSVEPCYIKEVGKADDEKIEAIAIYFLDLDPRLNHSLQDAKNANYRLFYLPKEDKYSFSMNYRNKVENKTASKIQCKTFIARSELLYSNSDK